MSCVRFDLLRYCVRYSSCAGRYVEGLVSGNPYRHDVHAGTIDVDEFRYVPLVRVAW